MQIAKWLYPGLKIKRWAFLVALGFLLLGMGLSVTLDRSVLQFVEAGVLRPYRRWAAAVGTARGVATGALLVFLGLSAVLLGLRNTVGSALSALTPGREGRFIDLLYRKRSLEKGHQIVVVGGGTGLSTLLRGLKLYSSNITAIVTVADDGGSSGILRRDMGVLPPGDIRNCLVALADTESLMENLFRYRYTEGSLKGHSFGNLFIATLSDVAGSFETAVKLSSRVLAVRGQVLPSTLSDVTLKAVMTDGSVVLGESAIPKSGLEILSVELVPKRPAPLPEALDALSRADVIVLGPGSLYTSVIPTLLVEGMADAVRASRALKLYICNVMTQPGETDGYSVSEHIAAIQRHVGAGLVDYVIVNTKAVGEGLRERYREEGAEPVTDDSDLLLPLGIKAVRRELASLTNLVRHDSAKLAACVMELVVGPQASARKRRRGATGPG